jgi:hypothetical protein
MSTKAVIQIDEMHAVHPERDRERLKVQITRE